MGRGLGIGDSSVFHPHTWRCLLKRDRLTHSRMGGLVLYWVCSMSDDVYHNRQLTNTDLRVILHIIEIHSHLTQT